MTYEINLTLHKLSVITDDEISESSNEDITVSIECAITIDLNEYNQYLSNKIHKILWDLENNLIVLLFDEIIIWINIENDLAKPLYIVSLPSTSQSVKFRDMIFMFNGLLLTVVTNHGSLMFYQRCSPSPIHINDIDDKQVIMNIDWKQVSNANFNKV